MDNLMNDGVNSITCTTWVPKGAAKHDPEKVEITKEELAKIIKTTSENLKELEKLEESDYSDLEVEALEEDYKIPPTKKNKSKIKNKDVEMKEIDGEKENENIEEMEEFEKKYKFEDYDTEPDCIENLLKLEKLSVYADNADDPNINKEDEDAAISERENNKIYPTDSLITVGHVIEEAAVLEVYVYNEEEESLYVHHDILLPSVPLCMEWLNYDAEDENLKPGNLVAIGSMSPIIEIWDLDIIDCLEPAYTLGRRPKKNNPRIGHSDAVLCLGWNRDLDHILASGSADSSILIWDLQKCEVGQKLSEFTDNVQDLKWHPKENHYLLAGSSDKTVKLFDCLSDKNNKSWELDGEVETVAWDPCVNSSYNFVAGTNTGSVYVIDSRQEKPLQKLNAHDNCCSGVVMNSQLPGCLVTVAEENVVRIWDLYQQPCAKLVDEREIGIGVIHSVSCSPDSPFVLSFGGNNKMDNFKVWDIRSSKKVLRSFEDRLNLPVSDGEEEEDDNKIVTGASNSKGKSSSNNLQKSASAKPSNRKSVNKSMKMKVQGDFEDRLDLPVNDSEEEEDNKIVTSASGSKSKSSSNNVQKSSSAKPSNWKPVKKSTKKKGGHLDKRRKK